MIWIAYVCPIWLIQSYNRIFAKFEKKIKNHVIVEVKEKIFLPHYDSTILIPS